MDKNARKKTWEMISPLLKHHMRLEGKEIIYQDAVDLIFRNLLDWPSESIDREFKVQQGSRPTKVDFVLKCETGEHIPLEVKTSDSCKTEIGQLGSYMLHLKSTIGILLKDNIYLFHDDEYGRNIKSLEDSAVVIPFDGNTELGAEFVEKMYFPTFCVDDFNSFLKAALAKRKEEEEQMQMYKRIEEYIQSKQFVVDSIKDEILRREAVNGIDEQLVEEVLAEFKLTLEKKSEDSKKIMISESPRCKSEKAGERHKFIFMGETYYSMSDLAYDIISRYVTETNCNLQELKESLKSMGVTTSVVKEDESFEGNNRSWPERMRIQLPGDKSRIRVYTMWNHYTSNDNFTPLLDFAKKHGMDIEEL